MTAVLIGVLLILRRKGKFRKIWHSEVRDEVNYSLMNDMYQGTEKLSRLYNADS